MRQGAVYMNGKLAGILTEISPTEYVFKYDDTYYADDMQPAVSLTLPKTQQEYRSAYLFPFFSNMLSEGRNRIIQSRMLHIDENDHFGILLATAQTDVAGAVTVKPEGYDSYSPIAIKNLFDGRQVSPFLDYTPIDDDNNSAAQEEFLHNQERISLSGVQPKYSMIVRNGKLALTQKGEQGHYILKPKLSDFRNRIYSSANENLTMQIASQVFGIETAANGLCFFKGGEPAYITKRFDVKPDGTKRRKEDFASLAGLTTQNGGKNYKYEYLTYEECGELIRRYLPAWKVETLKFFDLIIFNFLICNGDAHLKNFSVLETESGDFRLSPAYDLINTKLHVDDRIFALDKGLLKDNAAESMPYGMTNSTTFREFGKRLGLPDKTIRRELDKFCTSYPLLDTLIANSYLSDELKENYRNMYLGRRDSYLKIGL